MAEQLNQWLDRFVENGSDPNNVPDWPENSGVKVQSDWGQTDSTQPDFIKNKELVTNLIKSDAEGNVYINSGFTEEYVLAAEYDATATYYEAYHSIDDTKLTGSWYCKQSTTPTNYPTTFTEGTAFTEGFGQGLNYISAFRTPSSSGQINLMDVFYYEQGGTKHTNMGPMWWIDRWNIEELSFNMENASLLEWVKTYFTKRSDTYYTDEYPTLTAVLAYDAAHPKYREIELTEETFISNTYYILQKNPTWVNVKDLINNGN